MPDVMSLKDWLVVLATIFGSIGAAVAAIAVLFGRWRKQEDKAKDEYIATLKATNDELRDMNDTLRRENGELVSKTSEQDGKIATLVGKMSMLERLVLKVCPRFEASENGSCMYCTRGLAYGQAPGGG